MAKIGSGSGFQMAANAFFILFSIFCLVPFLMLISISISSEEAIKNFGYTLLPKSIDFLAYRILLADSSRIINAYLVTLAVVAVGTSASLLVNSLVAYPLSRKEFKYRKYISFYFYFTMLFSGGLVPTYILITRYLHLKDTFLILFLPGMVSAWTIILFRTFMMSIPKSLLEAAFLDGASEPRVYWQIIVPLSKPAFATLGLFSVLAYWNDWFTPLLYIENKRLFPVQFLLQRSMQTIEFLKQNAGKIPGSTNELIQNLPTESARMALAVLVALPIVLIFPFFQKFFVRGLQIGSIKG